MVQAVCCTHCQSVGLKRYMRSGLPRLGLLLLCLFIVPGVVYFAWHFLSGHWGCSTCGSRKVVPLIESDMFRIRTLKVEQGLA
jgi:hypothetical protein